VFIKRAWCKIPKFSTKKTIGRTMHVKGFLHKLLSSVIHKKRLVTLTILVMTVLEIKKLSLTELGRGMDLPIQERSGIRRADRFLGNTKLYKDRIEIYKTISKAVVGDRLHPWIIVDWSEVPNTMNHILRAACIADGRAITLYEEVHPENKLGNPKVEKRFLTTLKSILPEACLPVIVTDAGFHNKWFTEVLKLNWDYVGRVRGRKKYSADGKTWDSFKKLFIKATMTPKYVGEIQLCRSNALETHLYLFKNKPKGRSSLNLNGKKRRDSNTMDQRKAAKEPWLLVSSLSGRSMAKRIIKIYKKRMQIEEGFRDLKSSRYGFSFEDSHSKKQERIQILLLIAALAALIAWLTGWVIEKNKLHYQFQSNTIKTRRVLSLFYLGCQAIKRKITIPLFMLETAINRGIVYA
jgi:hypothetical protein